MNKNTVLCLFLLFAMNLSAKDRVIENPAYEFNSSGLFDVSRIELGDNETRVHIHASFIPHWWVMFGKNSYIEDCATGKKWFVSDILNGELDKKIFMPDSGDSTFILVFPKIDKSVVKINYKEEDINGSSTIYGISLNPNVKRRPPDNKLPYGIQKWIDSELAKAKRKTPMNFAAGEFFSNDTARLIGYIKGYDKRAGFSTGIIYLSNEITRQDLPRVARIFPDGRFECLLPLEYPQNQTVSFQNRRIDFYIQPGTTLSMILDWEEFRTADRLRNIDYKFSDIQFGGATAEVNNELAAFYAKLGQLPYNKIFDEMNKKSPDEYKTLLDGLTSKYAEACRQTATNKNMSALAKSIIKNDYAIKYASFLMEYAMEYGYRGERLPVEFYEFLKDVPVNNRQILTSRNFSTFINRLEYSNVFNERYKSQTPEKSLKQYLYKELGLPQTPEDTKFYAEIDSLSKQIQFSDITDDEKRNINAKIIEANKAFEERYKQQINDYKKKYYAFSRHYSQISEWKIIDSIYTDVLKLKLGLVSDVIKTRQLERCFHDVAKYENENGKKILAYLKKSLHEDFLKQESEQLFDKYFSPNSQKTYQLPDTEDALAFKKIIEPFKGKYLLVDFWATWCGPCVHGIKESKNTRKSYKDSKDVAFVYITSDADSPTNKYEPLVKEQELTNSFRVSEIDYQYFRQLFAFNGIPHYVFVDREGRILNNVTGYFDFETVLKELLENEK
ncbi:MAG: TlpA family protein disulfide reductase [Prevotellaceae bacterium]|nr:TlpA family protein disulfide reductase [Prevotellaceae bacterium]